MTGSGWIGLFIRQKCTPVLFIAAAPDVLPAVRNEPLWYIFFHVETRNINLARTKKQHQSAQCVRDWLHSGPIVICWCIPHDRDNGLPDIVDGTHGDGIPTPCFMYGYMWAYSYTVFRVRGSFVHLFGAFFFYWKKVVDLIGGWLVWIRAY